MQKNISWEQRKLPEFVSFFNGLTYTPNDVQETGTLVLRYSNVRNGEIVDADNVYVSDKVATSENVQEGNIIVVVRNGSRALIGKHAQIKTSMPNTVIGAFMYTYSYYFTAPYLITYLLILQLLKRSKNRVIRIFIIYIH